MFCVGQDRSRSGCRVRVLVSVAGEPLCKTCTNLSELIRSIDDSFQAFNTDTSKRVKYHDNTRIFIKAHAWWWWRWLWLMVGFLVLKLSFLNIQWSIDVVIILFRSVPTRTETFVPELFATYLYPLNIMNLIKDP